MILIYWRLLFDKSHHIIIHSAPEYRTALEKKIFVAIIKLKLQKCIVSILVRDFREEKCGLILKRIKSSKNLKLFTETSQLSINLERKISVTGVNYIFPSPTFINKKKYTKVPQNKKLRVGVTGGFSPTRRDYSVLNDFIDNDFVEFSLLGSGEKIKDNDRILFCELHDKYLTDDELDKLVLTCDVLIDLNKSSFYGESKGTGAIGDAFYYGIKLITPNVNHPAALAIQCELDTASLTKLFLQLKLEPNRCHVDPSYRNTMKNKFQSILDI